MTNPVLKPGALLQGWKEIAVYTARDVRTVRRWEKERGLPVRRFPGEGRATVYAVVAELDEWLQPARMNQEAPPLQSEKPVAVMLDPDTAAVIELGPVTQSAPAGWSAWTRPGIWLVYTALIVLSLGFAAFFSEHPAHRMTAVADEGEAHAAASHATAYRSKLAGVDEPYLRAAYLCEQRTPDSLTTAEAILLDVLAKDPQYAPAWSTLATTYILEREYSMVPSEQAYPKAKAAAERALVLDPALSSAHASLGFVDFFWFWQPALAKHEFQTAVALDANAPLPHHWYGSMLMHEARYQEALAQLSIAQHLQPDSVAIMETRAYALGLSGHRDEAMLMLRELSKEDRNSPGVHQRLAALDVLQRPDLSQYLVEDRLSALLRHDAEALAQNGRATEAYRSSGDQAMWRQLLHDECKAHNHQPTYRTAELEAVSGEQNDALRHLEVLYEAHDWGLIGLDIDPFFTTLHGTPRFLRLVAAMRLPAPGDSLP